MGMTKYGYAEKIRRRGQRRDAYIRGIENDPTKMDSDIAEYKGELYRIVICDSSPTGLLKYTKSAKSNKLCLFHQHWSPNTALEILRIY